LLSTGDPGVDEVPLKQHVVLGTEGNDHRGVFGALGFVDAGGVGQRDFVKFTKLIFHYLDSAIAAGSLESHDTVASSDQFLSLFLGSAHIKAMLGLGKPAPDEDQLLVARNVAMFLRAYGGLQTPFEGPQKIATHAKIGTQPLKIR
jgi:hypothetical protein